jgi:preprotein translocase subunit SecA
MEFEEVCDYIRDKAKDNARDIITTTIGEYVDEEADKKEWDLKGLSSWAMSTFRANISQNQLRQMELDEMVEALVSGAEEQIDKHDLTDLQRFMDPRLGRRRLVTWCNDRFPINLKFEEIENIGEKETEDRILEKVDEVYQRREIEYPVEYALETAFASAGTDSSYATNELAQWVKQKFNVDMPAEKLMNRSPDALHDELVQISEDYQLNGKLTGEIDSALTELGDEPSRLADWARDRFNREVRPEELGNDPEQIREQLLDYGRQFLRSELTELERYVLLNIHDGAWKDHLLAMDHLRDSIGLRGYAERDPKIEYKKEGMRMFREMCDGIADKVTDVILKARLTGPAAMRQRSVWNISNMQHEEAASIYAQLVAQGAATGGPGGGGEREMYAGGPRVAKPIKRDQPKIGRNDPCPCGSGKKYKKCCGAKK